MSNPFLDFKPEEDDLSNFAAALAAKGKKGKLDIRRQAAMNLITKSLTGGQDRMIGGGSNGSFGSRPGILVPGNTAATALAGVVGAGVGKYSLDQADKQDAAREAARDKAFSDAIGSSDTSSNAMGSIGGASANSTDLPTALPTDTSVQADSNSVRKNLERGMDPQLANATGATFDDLSPAGDPEPQPQMQPQASLPTGGLTASDMAAGTRQPFAPARTGNGDLSVNQLLQLARDFPEQSKSINSLIQAKSWESRDAASQPAKQELAAQKLQGSFELQSQRLQAQAEQAMYRAQSQAEQRQVMQQFQAQQNAMQREFMAQQNAMYRTQGGGANKPPSGYQWNPDGSGSLVAIPGGPAGKPTAAQVAGMAGATAGVNQVDRAWAEIDANPDALGLKNFLPDEVMQRLDPKGVSTRAAVANIGSQMIHDRAGAAATASETPRLKPFIPLKTDTPAAAKIKLQKMRENMEEAGMTFAPPSVAESLKQTLAPKPAAKTTTKTTAKVMPTVGEVRGGRKYLGGNPADPKSWGAKQ